jgi:hypothetical protein
MHVERVLREYGQLPRPMNEAPRDGTRILGHHPRSGRLILCYWETIPEALVGPIWVEGRDGRRGYLDRYFDGWLDPQEVRLLDTDAVNRLLVAYIDDARAADDTAALKLLEQA